ncbi:unnamed protein product [Pylaiella littoralis]
MGEDVWSLVARQLYSPSTNTTTDQQQGAESKEGGRVEGNGPDGDAGNREVAAAAAGTTATAAAAASAFSSFALCVGMPGAGKSTLLNAYLNPNNDSVPKPTVALEYMFARRARAANMPKDVAHIWELGGGSHVSDLVRVPITPDRFHDALYVIVVDLSRPSSVIPHLLHWTDQIKACVKVCVRDMAKRDPSFADTLKKKTYAKLGRDHPDLRAVRPCPVPLVIVGNKYDMFKNNESVRKRTLSQALRFVAHINGASLLFCSAKDKKLKDVFRLALNTHLFRANSRKAIETNPEKPLSVPAGSDTLDAILKVTPPGTRREDFVSGNAVTDVAMDSWRRAVEDVFGPADLNDEPPVNHGGGNHEGEKKENDDDDNGNPFPEAAVDEHRAQRDEILRRYRKDAERKAKLAMKAVDAPHRAPPPSSKGVTTAAARSTRRQSRSSSSSGGTKASPSTRK